TIFKQIEIARSSASNTSSSDASLYIHSSEENVAMSSTSDIYTIKSMGAAVIPLKVLIISPDPDHNPFAKLLNGFDDLQADLLPQSSLVNISVETLADYPVVIVTNNSQWLAVGGVSGEKVGNVLADYVDAGGKVIV